MKKIIICLTLLAQALLLWLYVDEVETLKQENKDLNETIRQLNTELTEHELKELENEKI